MQQAACQCRPTSGNSFNCIVFGKLEKTGGLDKPRFAGLPWPGSTSVVVLGHGVGDQESGNPALFAIHSAGLVQLFIKVVGRQRKQSYGFVRVVRVVVETSIAPIDSFAEATCRHREEAPRRSRAPRPSSRRGDAKATTPSRRRIVASCSGVLSVMVVSSAKTISAEMRFPMRTTLGGTIVAIHLTPNSGNGVATLPNSAAK